MSFRFAVSIIEWTLSWKYFLKWKESKHKALFISLSRHVGKASVVVLFTFVAFSFVRHSRNFSLSKETVACLPLAAPHLFHAQSLELVNCQIKNLCWKYKSGQFNSINCQTNKKKKQKSFCLSSRRKLNYQKEQC